MPIPRQNSFAVAGCVASLFIASRASGDGFCVQHGSCADCANSSHWGLDCRWCPVDHRCYDPGSFYNPCSTAQVITNVSTCPSPPVPKTVFNRQVALELTSYALAAYYDNPSTRAPSSFKLASTFNFSLGVWDQAFGYVGMDALSRRVIVAFRGTDSLDQIANEVLHHSLVPYPGLPDGARVNQFFYVATAALQPTLVTILSSLLKACPGCDLIFTGHSLGGAMAMLSAFMASSISGGHPLAVYTFGQPRVGNHALAKHINAVLPLLFRVVNAADVIPHVPQCTVRSGGKCDETTNGYYHAGTELWFPYGDYENGVMCSYRECVRAPHSEDPSCSNGLMAMDYPPSIRDHHGYFLVLRNGYCKRQLAAAVDKVGRENGPLFV
mmetsp:Transcript_9465/g.18136  ORF Transcript_9465/g.18136 Transcript_9465/m.18136 type:complete len:382 (+) Transcript_9465:17-1162(+)